MLAKKKEIDEKQKKTRTTKKAVIQEWRQVRDSSSSGASCYSSEEISVHEAPHEEKRCHKEPERGARKSKKAQWRPKVTVETSSTSEQTGSNSESTDEDAEREYIYSQVCRRINQLILELDKLRQALPACENFLHKYKQQKQAEVMSAEAVAIKDDQVPAIEVDCREALEACSLRGD